MTKDQYILSPSGRTLKEYLWQQVVDRRLASPLGLALLLLCVLPLAWLFSVSHLGVGFVVVALSIGLPLVLFALFNPAINLGLMLTSAIMVTFLLRYVNAPLGLLNDGLILVGLVSLLLGQFRERDGRFMQNSLSYMILIWLFYNGLMVLNPEALSRLSWLFTVRTVALQLLVFFIGAYALRNNKQALYYLLYFIFAICFVCAAYGVKQHYWGLTPGEMAWIMSDSNRAQLYIQWNLVRVPSLCYDPTTFGNLMAFFAVMCGILMAATRSWLAKGLFLVMIVTAIMGMSFSGTRTSVVIIPLGLLFYMLLTLNRKVLIAGGIMLMLGGVLMVKSTTNGVIYRLQSAFKPEDDSMQVRLKNQARIQPFIRSHPIGAGLGSCGAWGGRFAPGSWLSTFNHDSSFVRMAVELGWIGLILYTLMHFVAIRTGIYYYHRCRDPWIKATYAAIATACYMLAVACYSQEAILQQPINTIYNIFLAMLVTLKNFDPAFAAPASNNPLPNTKN
ncbi:MAG: O-antigen ligase family protein [Saprospiraceae bacterium]|nr:O-antigen ligase family protein [Saprospiraceae bacterium]